MQLFPALKTVNSLYQSFAINLVIAHKQGRLQNLLNKNIRFQRTILKLIKETDSSAQDNPQGSDQYMKTLMGGFTRDDKTIDWIKLQLDLGAALRRVVVDSLRTEPELQTAVKKELSKAYSESLDRATTTFVEYFKGAPEAIWSRYQISTKDASTKAQKEKIFQEWLDTEGFDLYLKGLSRITQDRFFVGTELECKLLSHLFGVRIKYSSNNIPDCKDCYLIEGFKEKPSGQKLVTFLMQYSALGWDALFSQNTGLLKNVLAEYQPQLNHFVGLNPMGISRRNSSLGLGKRERPTPPRPDFKASSYFTMLSVLTAAFMFCSHCMFLPLLLPLLHCGSLITHGASLLLSLSLSLVVTEKFQDTQNNGLLKLISFNDKTPAPVLQKLPLPVATESFHKNAGLYFSGPYNQASSPLRSLIPLSRSLSFETIPSSLQSKLKNN